MTELNKTERCPYCDAFLRDPPNCCREMELFHNIIKECKKLIATLDALDVEHYLELVWQQDPTFGETLDLDWEPLRKLIAQVEEK